MFYDFANRAWWVFKSLLHYRSTGRPLFRAPTRKIQCPQLVKKKNEKTKKNWKKVCRHPLSLLNFAFKIEQIKMILIVDEDRVWLLFCRHILNISCWHFFENDSQNFRFQKIKNHFRKRMCCWTFKRQKLKLPNFCVFNFFTYEWVPKLSLKFKMFTLKVINRFFELHYN